MSQTDSVPTLTSPQNFEAALQSLFAAAHRGGVTFDRSWTFRRADESPDLMVEVTRLANRTGETATCGDHAPEMSEPAFEAELSSLLRRVHRSGVTFDRSWTLRYVDGPDLMVEVTRLAKPDETVCSP